MDRVAIVVLSYNGVSVSKKFLDSLRKHTNPDKYQLVWIDNGSTDETVDMLNGIVNDDKRDFDLHCVFSPINTGVIGGRNMGFDLFNGSAKDTVDLSDCNFLMFIDNDQFVKAGWLEQHLSVINSGYDLVGVEAWQMNDNFLPTCRIENLSHWFAYVGCGGMIIRRTAVDKLGKFDDVFNPSYYEDPDYCFRAYKDGLSVGWNFAARIIHLPHQTLGNAPDKSQRFLKSYQAFRAKWHGHKPPRFLQQKLIEFSK